MCQDLDSDLRYKDEFWHDPLPSDAQNILQKTREASSQLESNMAGMVNVFELIIVEPKI